MTNSDAPAPPAQVDMEPAPVILAMFDILGFSARLERDGIASIHQLYRNLIERVVLQPQRRCLGAVATPKGRVATIFGLPVEYAYFSDTILLWVPLLQMYAGAFVDRCADMMCEALAGGVPLRGAITIGDAIMHSASRTYIGRPIVEAARLEHAQDWIGLTFGNSAMWPRFVAELDGPTLIEYPAPMKPDSHDLASPVVVDWPRIWRDRHHGDLAERLVSLNVAPAFTRYYDNAIAFVRYSTAHHDWFKHPERIPDDAQLRFVPYDSIMDA